MPLREYRCEYCNSRVLVFDDEAQGKLYPVQIKSCPASILWDHGWVQTPPSPVVVHATETVMSTETRLDSHSSIYELDRILNIEARTEVEMKALQEARRNQ